MEESNTNIEKKVWPFPQTLGDTFKVRNLPNTPEFDEHEALTFGPVGDVNSNERGSGARYNQGKAKFNLIPLNLLDDTARVWEYGAKKYAAWNWAKGADWNVPFDSLMRHLAAWQNGEDIDPESGLPHTAHIICNAMMLVHYERFYPEGDNRPKGMFDVKG